MVRMERVTGKEGFLSVLFGRNERSLRLKEKAGSEGSDAS